MRNDVGSGDEAAEAVREWDAAEELRWLASAARRTPTWCACCQTPTLRGQEFCPACRLLRSIARTASLECLERALVDKRAGLL